MILASDGVWEFLSSQDAVNIVGEHLATRGATKACQALIEAAANKERRVQEIPAFNIFDNFADLIVVFVALLLAIIPGYLIGSAFSGEDMSFFKIAGMVLGGFALFPIFLLSMLDHGSMFNPISASVLRSLREATESWGAYFLKTLAASFVMLVIWLVLLGRSPAMSGIAGFLLPLLFFFTCQQVGTLADGIADHLSFEFQPSEDDDEQDADAGLA